MDETAQEQQQQPPLQQQERPPNNEIIRQAKALVIHMYGENGYTLGDDPFVMKKPYFKSIVFLDSQDKPALIREIHRRYDCCARLKIKTVRERPIRNLTHESVVKLKAELKVVVPSAIPPRPPTRMS